MYNTEEGKKTPAIVEYTLQMITALLKSGVLSTALTLRLGVMERTQATVTRAELYNLHPPLG